MAIRVWVLGDPRDFDPTGAGLGAILHPRFSPTPDPNNVGFGAGFIWHTRVNLTPEVAYRF
jgi:hypothetical protein